MDLKVENGMSGEEAIRKLLEIDPTIKIIASSGYSSNPLITNFQRYGIKGILPKPFNIKDLIATLNRFL